MRLWYDRPAADWEREVLPLGNGALGATVSGGLPTERLQLNEKTLWTGGPGAADGYTHGDWPRPGGPAALGRIRRRISAEGALPPAEVAAELGQPRRGYGAYQRLADLLLELPHRPAAVTGYQRELDLRQALAGVRYAVGGVTHHREYLVSHPGQVVAGRLWADRPGAVSVTLRLVPGPADAVVAATGTGRLRMDGALADNRLRFAASLRVDVTGGEVNTTGGRVTVTDADELTFVLAAGTDYHPAPPSYRAPSDHPDGPAAQVETVAAAAATTGYPELRAAHVADHRRLFERFTLDLDAPPPAVPTDRLLAAYRGTGRPTDRALEALHLAYGRYLLIASSRPGSLPANLQGVWNDSDRPPWHCDYHLNINLQMCYWPAEVTNLAECAAPLHGFVEALRAPGRVTAERMFGTDGWVVHSETNPYGFTGVQDWPTSFWFPEAAAWLARHLWEHYLFTGDRGFLRRCAWPVLRETCGFWLANLREDPRDGTLVVTPSYSPEHGDFTAGAAVSQQIVWDLLRNTLDAADALAGPADPATAAFRRRLADTYARLDPGLRTGSWGQLREWKDDRDDPADRHRHLSHLYALYPGRQLSPAADPALAAAAAVSLRARTAGPAGCTDRPAGSDATDGQPLLTPGWSRAWQVALWARLGDGDAAHRALAALLRENTLPNLWDTHPPFQLDGNLGAVAGVAELLVQSHLGVVEVLPALPTAWPDGAVHGLRARGGLTLDIRWRRGAAVDVALTADSGGEVTLRCPPLADRPLVDARTGAPVPRSAGPPGGWRFTARAGHRYRVVAAD